MYVLCFISLLYNLKTHTQHTTTSSWNWQTSHHTTALSFYGLTLLTHLILSAHKTKKQIGPQGLVDHGVHAFIVPLRDEAGRCLPGVEIHDCGYKVRIIPTTTTFVCSGRGLFVCVVEVCGSFECVCAASQLKIKHTIPTSTHNHHNPPKHRSA